MGWWADFQENRRLRRLIDGKTALNLGAAEKPWPGYVTCGLTKRKVQVLQDATKPYPKPFLNQFEFIWSERMLEHIEAEQFENLFRHLWTIMKPGAKARFCLPICFFGTPEINMIRAGNAEKCESLGHISWFTFEGFGAISPEDFGADAPPLGHMTWDSLLEPLGLRFESVRHYGRDGQLVVNRDILTEERETPFSDRPEVIVNRIDSLIFDVVRVP